MELGNAKTSGKDVDEEIGGEIDGGSAIEGGGRRGHQKALWKKRERERGREREGEGEEKGRLGKKMVMGLRR